MLYRSQKTFKQIIEVISISKTKNTINAALPVRSRHDFFEMLLVEIFGFLAQVHWERKNSEVSVYVLAVISKLTF